VATPSEDSAAAHLDIQVSSTGTDMGTDTGTDMGTDTAAALLIAHLPPLQVLVLAGAAGLQLKALLQGVHLLGKLGGSLRRTGECTRHVMSCMSCMSSCDYVVM
jgi:hypothetical protein